LDDTFEDGITDYEYDYIFVSNYSGNIEPDVEANEEYGLVDLNDSAADLLNAPDYCYVWFQIAAPKGLELVMRK